MQCILPLTSLSLAISSVILKSLDKTEQSYEAHPQSKFPWGRVQKLNTIAWKYLVQQIQQVFRFFQLIRHRN
jgi:hypothetical protein